MQSAKQDLSELLLLSAVAQSCYKTILNFDDLTETNSYFALTRRDAFSIANQAGGWGGGGGGHCSNAAVTFTADFADLLCLFGDLDMTMWSDIVLTVSLKDTTGSEILISAPPMKSSCKSFRQISRCSSPAPAFRNTQARDTDWNYTSVRLFYYKVGQAIRVNNCRKHADVAGPK